MTKEFWINLPVKSVARSREFFAKLGYSFNKRFDGSTEMASMTIGQKNVVVMLCAEHVFRGFTGHDTSDAKQQAEVLFSIDAESREEVDELFVKAVDAGAVPFGQPGESQGWMYGCGFSDLDGHRWNILYMDMEKMPK